MEKRLQKIIAELGIASRRAAEEMIIEGRVTVNGQPAHVGMKADTDHDHIKLDGKLITRGAEPKVYYLFYKPVGVVTSLSDPEGRPTVKDFFSKIRYRVFPVGRLDFDSEGMLFVTNDGDFAHKVLHPSQKLPKTYKVKIKGTLEDDAIKKLERGIHLDDGPTAPAKIKKIRKYDSNSWVEITIHEGRKRQVRRMFQRFGHGVIRLIRIKIGHIPLGNLKPGELFPLSAEDVKKIMQYMDKVEGGK